MMWQLCTQRVDGKRAHRRDTMSPDQDLDIGSPNARLKLCQMMK
jgi:hypothetical protein